MPTHRYVSILRSGLGAVADHATDDRPRLTVDVTIDAEPGDPISAELAIAGPGDVRGLERGQIIGRTPAPGSEDAEPNRFASVQFATPDLPWLFSLAPTEDRGTTPWLALVVVPEHAAELRTPASSPSPVLVIPQDAGRHLPDPAELWAWAHVREVEPRGGSEAGGAAGSALAASARSQVAQLLCPRRLAPETDHLVAVVPVYEAGRRQGLGEDVDDAGSAFAWSVPDDAGTGGTDALELPAYDHWHFRTSARGDFASLARLLEPAQLPDTAGSRPITVREPAPDALVESTFELRAPLGSPALGVPHDIDAAAHLRDAVEAADDVLAPPARGNEHAGATSLPDDGWRAQANLHPTYRAAAGIAAEVVRGLEEELVAAAREQAGDLDGVNDLLGRSQLSRALGHRFHERLRTIAAADPATLLDVAAPVHGRVRLDGASAATTLAGSHLAGVGDVGLTRASRRLGPRSRTATALERLATTGPRVLDPGPPPGCETAPRGPVPDRFERIPDPDGHERQYPVDRPPKLPDLTPREDVDVDAYHRSASAQAARSIDDLSRPGARAARAVIDAGARAEELLERLDPEVTVPARADARLEVPEELRDANDRLAAVRVAPEIVRPLSLELGAVNDDLLLSGLADLAPDRITAAVPDDAVAAASMLGANEQLLRMLRWRRFPVPHAWTPLRRFWPRPDEAGPDPAPDTQPIDSWSATDPLADHLAGDVELVVLLRGELLRRYPDTVVAMVAGRWEGDDAVPSNSAGRTTPLFRANLPPDVTVMGFGVDPEEAVGASGPEDGGAGWFLLLQEPSQSPVYGLAEPGPDQLPRDPDADDPLVGVSWRDVGVERGDDHPFAPIVGRLGGATDSDGRSWGGSSAQQAGITLQRTTRVYVHLAELLGA